MKISKRIYRILDANFNRSREGFRVCEEIARFVLDDAKLTGQLKKCRHTLSDTLKDLPVEARDFLLSARAVAKDVGRAYSAMEGDRPDPEALFLANIQRCKESLRVLEETSKLLDKKIPSVIKKVRFETYDIEKRTLPKLAALRDHGRKKKGS